MKHVRRTNYTFLRSPFGLVLLAAAACVMPAAPHDPDPGEPQFELTSYDARGLVVPLGALPRRPEFVLSSTRALEVGAELLLFHGPPDAELLTDLADLPLRAAHDARRIAGLAGTAPNASTLVFQPRTTLSRGAAYTLALPGSTRVRGAAALAEEEPAFVVELRTRTDAAAGAAWLATLPPDGASGVPPNLAAIVLALDGEAIGTAEGVWLEDERGLAQLGSFEPAACEDLDSRAATCLVLGPAEPLAPSAHYRLRSGRALRDASGATIEALTATFATGAASDVAPPAFDPPACLRDEQAVAIGCALLEEQRVRVRVSAREPIALSARSGGRQAAALLPSGAGALELGGFAPGEAFELELRASDLAGNVTEARSALQTPAALATLSITEVRADPAGPEPAQEYVEIRNFGPVALELQGAALVDAADDRPSVVVRSAELPAGAYALLVPDAFDPASDSDPAPPPGVRLIRLGATLTRSGLANGGERLFLRDARSRRTSAVPMRPAPGPGRCLQRLPEADPRSDAAADFSEAPCTPGR